MRTPLTNVAPIPTTSHGPLSQSIAGRGRASVVPMRAPRRTRVHGPSSVRRCTRATTAAGTLSPAQRKLGYHVDPMGAPPRALEGLRVLDQTQVMAGPFCSMLLADMGADVIKIEPPGGETTRGMDLEAAPGVSAPFLAVNRNKRGFVLDLK